MNSTCGASNVSFGLPNREGINAAFLPMAIATGLTSAITNPLLPRCGPRSWPPTSSWATTRTRPLDPRTFREPPAEGEAAAGGSTGRRGRRVRSAAAGGRRDRATAPIRRAPAEPLVIFTPSGRRGRFPDGTTVLDAARALGVDIDSVCGGRGLCGRCQVPPGAGDVPQARHHVAARAPLAGGRRRGRVSHGPGPRRRPAALAAPPSSTATSSSTSRPRARSIARSSARALDVRDFVIDPVVRLHYVEVRTGRARDAGRRPRPPVRGARSASGTSTDLEADLDVVRALQPALEARRRPGHRRRPRRARRHRRLAGPPRSGLRRRHRRRLDDDRRPPRRPRRRRGPRLRRRDEPADPLRRGPHEPRLVRDAPRRRGGRDDPRRPRRPRRASSPGWPTPAGIDARGHPRAGRRRQPDHASPRCSGSTRSRSARRRSRSPPIGRSGRPPPSSSCRLHPGARVYVLPCIAGHVGADTAGVILAEDAAPRRAGPALIVDVGTNAEIVLGTGIGCSPPRARPGPPSRAPRSAAASGPRRARSSGSGSTARRSSRGSGSSARPAGRTSPGSRASSAGSASPASAGRGSSRSSPSCSWPASITADGIVDGALAARSPRVVPDGRTFSLRPPRAAEPATEARSPRIVITQNDVRAIQLAKAALYAGVRLLMDHLGVERSTRSAWPGRSAARSTSLHAMVLGLVPDCDLAHASAGRQRGRHRGAHRPPVGRGPARDREGRPAGREDRDRDRAALPGALRRGDGVPPPDRRLSPSRRGGRAAGRAARSTGERTAGPGGSGGDDAVVAAGSTEDTLMDEAPRRRAGGRAGATGAAGAPARRRACRS